MKSYTAALIAIALLVAPGLAGAQEAAKEKPIYLSANPATERTIPKKAKKAPPETPAEETPQPVVEREGPPDVNIVVNIPATTLMLYENGELKIRSKVAVGTGIYPTPESKMSINHVVWNPWWIPPPADWAKDEEKTPPGPGNPLGLVKLPMARGYMFHGTNSRSSVGRAASHGCMRMYNQDAAALAWYLQTHFSNKTDPALRDKYKRNRRTDYYVRLNRRIPVELIYDPVDIVDGELIIFPDYYGKARWRGKDVIISTLLAHGIDREQIDEARVKEIVRRWPALETRIPLHRVVRSPEADRIAKLPAVDDRVRFFH